MKHIPFLQTAACVTLFFGALPQQAMSSDQWLKTTIIDFSNPIRVPGKTLPAGKYTFKLVQSPAMQLQVQIFNEHQSQILATVNTSPTFRERPPDKTMIIFYEAPKGQPEPIKAWLYPGDQYGREFIYSKSESASILQAMNRTDAPVVAQVAETAPVASGPAPEITQAPVAEVTEPVTATPLDTAQPEPTVVAPQPEPAPTTVTEPPVQEAAPTSVPEATTLPATGSSLPLVGMIGLLSIAGGLAIRLRG